MNSRKRFARENTYRFNKGQVKPTNSIRMLIKLKNKSPTAKVAPGLSGENSKYKLQKGSVTKRA